MENENRTLKESLLASEAARSDLTKVCAEHIRNAKSSALDNFKEFTERILCEREEMLSTLAAVRFCTRVFYVVPILINNITIISPYLHDRYPISNEMFEMQLQKIR